jgi:hypothetical protein
MQLEATLRHVAAGGTVASAARELHLSLAGLRYALAHRTDYRSPSREYVQGGRRDAWVRIDPDVYLAMRERAAREATSQLELVERAIRQYLSESAETASE